MRAAFEPWDLQLARNGIELMGDRRAALDAVSEPFAGCCDLLGLDGEPRIAYRPRSRAATVEELVAELGSAFLCADLALTPEVREDHAAYIGHWLEAMRNDKRLIFTSRSTHPP